MESSVPQNARQQYSLQTLHQDAATITLLIDPEFFEAQPELATNPASWGEANFRAVCPENFPSVRLFFSQPGGGRSQSGQVVAAQFSLRDYDALTATRLLQSRLLQWTEELGGSGDKRTPASNVSYDHKTGRAILRHPATRDPLSKAQYVPVQESIRNSLPEALTSAHSQRPTLFSLLSRLSDPSVTTVEQRFAIRHILTDYLNNEIPSGKVFSYLGQVVGYQVLDDIIKSLSATPSPPAQQSLNSSRIQQYLHLQHPPTTSGGTTQIVVGTAATAAAAPNSTSLLTGSQRQTGLKFSPSLPKESFDAATDDVTQRSVQYHKSLLFKAFVKSLKWLYPQEAQNGTLLKLGQQAVLLDRKVFFLGGVPRSLQSSNVDDPTFQKVRVMNLATLTTKPMAVEEPGCPPSMVGHTCHFATLASGPIVVLQGGIIVKRSPDVLSTRVVSPHVISENLEVSPGDDGNAEMVYFNTNLYGLDMISQQWTKLDDKSNQKPPLRHSHASAIYPNASEVISGASAPYAEHLIVFGGIGFVTPAGGKVLNKSKDTTPQSKTPMCQSIMSDHNCQVAAAQLIPLNDLWIYTFTTGQWTQIISSHENVVPSPRFGMNLYWVTANSLLLFGGEGRQMEGVVAVAAAENADSEMGYPPGEKVLYGDTWILQLMVAEKESETESEPVPVNMKWIKSSAPGPSRAHYSGVALTAFVPPTHASSSTTASANPDKEGLAHESFPCRPLWSSSVESAMTDVKKMGWATQRLVILISGTTKSADGIFLETPSVLFGLIYPKAGAPDDSSFLVVWKSVEDIPLGSGHIGPPFKGRRNAIALYFDALAQLPKDQVLQDQLKAQKLAFKENEIVSHPQKEKNGPDLEIQNLNDRQTPYKILGKVPTSVPCILVVGGYTETSKGRRLQEDVWVLKLSKLLPRFLQSSQKERISEKRLLMGLILSGTKCTPSLATLINGDSEDNETLDSNHSGFSLNDLRIMRSVWTDPARNYLPAMYQVGEATSTGLIWALASLVKHNLSPFSHLLDNCVQSRIKASNVSFCFEKFYGYEAISINDDGLGLYHKELHILLKRFGQSCDHLSKQGSDHFGLGFKLAVGRLAHNALVFTKTAWTVGVGLFSTPLNSLMGTTIFSTPVACWSTRDGFPLVVPAEEAEFGQIVGMILNNSPLVTSVNLEKEFEKFGKGTGTRIVLFGLRKDLPYPVVRGNGHVEFTSYANGHQLFSNPTLEAVRASSYIPPDLPISHYNNVMDSHTEEDTTMSEVDQMPAAEKNLKTAAVQKNDDDDAALRNGIEFENSQQQQHSSSKDNNNNNDLLICRPLPGTLSKFQINFYKIGQKSQLFPLWNTASSSIDYNLATYLYWSQLHCEQTIWLNGCCLTPGTTTMGIPQTTTAAASNENSSSQLAETTTTTTKRSDSALRSLKETGIELPSSDRYKNSLYRFLQKRLYYSLEVPFLFEPQFGEDHFYGLFGFLNDHLNMESTSQHVCEAGVLLYHKGRLINRALLKMPLIPEYITPPKTKGRIEPNGNLLTSLSLTAVINVPDFLTPRATKEDFIAESDLAMHDFYDRCKFKFLFHQCVAKSIMSYEAREGPRKLMARVEGVLRDYIECYDNVEKLNGLQRKYATQFDDYREKCWRARRRVRVDDDETMLPSQKHSAISSEMPKDVPRDEPSRRPDVPRRSESPSNSDSPVSKGAKQRRGSPSNPRSLKSREMKRILK